MGRILIVEDEVVVAMNAAAILQDAGYEIETAENGIDALELMRDFEPDLVLTDYMMPRMDGVELIEKLRATGWSNPIILVTSVAESRLPDSYSGGHDGYVMKPFLEPMLVGEVERHIGGKQSRESSIGDTREGE